MKKAKKSVTYEMRYKHKLNMLEPGMIMLKWIGILLVAGLVLLLFHLRIAAYIALGLAGAIFLVFMILLAIEAHQDSVLNKIALQENKEE